MQELLVNWDENVETVQDFKVGGASASLILKQWLFQELLIHRSEAKLQLMSYSKTIFILKTAGDWSTTKIINVIINCPLLPVVVQPRLVLQINVIQTISAQKIF